MMKTLLVVVAGLGFGCDPVPQIVGDAADTDAPLPTIPSTNRIDLVSASGRATGAGFTLDFEVGARHPASPSAGGGIELEPAAAIDP